MFANFITRPFKFQRASSKQDLNLQPHAPKACALPDCAITRFIKRDSRIPKQGFTFSLVFASQPGQQ